jgi:hypothetical protein
MLRLTDVATWRKLAAVGAATCCLSACTASAHVQTDPGSVSASLQTSASPTLLSLPTPGAAGASGASAPSAPQPGGTRSASEQIPATVQTATLDYTGPMPNTGQPTRAARHRILAGADLHALARVLNSLPALPPGTYSCSSDDGEQAVLTMAHRQFTMELSGCRQVSAVVDGVAQPVLEAALTDSLSRTIHGVLGDTPVGSRGPGASPAQ